MAHTPRKDEPVLFRQCYFLNLDWWGDAGGVYVRGESRTMPDCPHAVFEDCTIVSPDNALQAGYPGVDDLCTRVKFKDCRLIVLNFSQPQGTPSSGIICCGCKDGKQLHVDFENSTLMGYKVFGTRSGEVSYTIQGKAQAYVQFQQAVPAGFEHLKLWPVEVFDSIQPPRLPEATSADAGLLTLLAVFTQSSAASRTHSRKNVVRPSQSPSMRTADNRA